MNEWNNYTAVGYLRYALEHYNKTAGNKDNEDIRKLTKEETRRIIGCMKYAFDKLTLKEAYDRG